MSGKRRRIVYPGLNGVTPLIRQTQQQQQQQQQRVFPKFLHNALFSSVTEVTHGQCPFKDYIDLGGPAWKKKDESQYLIHRQSYDTLMAFLDRYFADFEVGTQQFAVVTGTAGIGKTMFALYAAREYFRRGEFVVLYYDTSVWAFTKTNPEEFGKDEDARNLDASLLLSKGSLPDGTDFWYGELERMANPEEAWRQWKSCGCAIIVRDPGTKKDISLVESSGREVYTVSTGQENFFWSVKKSGIPSAINQRVAALWSGDEFLYSIKLGLFSLGPSHALDTDYIMEGYRRYGGSARLVLEFAKLLKQHRRTKETLEGEPMQDGTLTLLAKIAESAVIGEGEANKTKATVFHRSPVGDTYRVHFASPYLGQQLMNAVKSRGSKALKTVVAALSITTGHQDAYGVLYEDEVHKRISADPSGPVQKTATLLDCHGPSLKRVKNIVAKTKVTMNFGRQDVVYFPGHSLQNACLEREDAPLRTYFQPMASNFPTHDSFILCPASDFFEAANTVEGEKKQEFEEGISKRVVLVGLQMTVSGSDAAMDKPSHPVHGTHLTYELEAIKTILANHPTLHILPDVVTVFFSPMESCRKMSFMPVLTATGTQLKSAIQNFGGIAPQYYTIFEVEMIEQLMSSYQINER